MNGVHPEVIKAPYNLEEFSAMIADRVSVAIEKKKEISLHDLPIVAHDDLVKVLEGLLEKYVEQDNSNGFLILFHAFRDDIERITPTLKWDETESHANSSMNIEIAKAIRALWEDGKRSKEGELLLKLAMKLGVIRQNDIERIRDLVGVSDSSGNDRI